MPPGKEAQDKSDHLENGLENGQPAPTNEPRQGDGKEADEDSPHNELLHRLRQLLKHALSNLTGKVVGHHLRFRVCVLAEHVAREVKHPVRGGNGLIRKAAHPKIALVQAVGDVSRRFK